MSIVSRLGSPAGALRILSLALGVFLIFMALDKIEWLTRQRDADAATSRMARHGSSAGPLVPRYGRDSGSARICARGGAGRAGRRDGVDPGNEGAPGRGVGVSDGAQLPFRRRSVFRYSYLINAYGLPILGGLLALAVGGDAAAVQCVRNSAFVRSVRPFESLRAALSTVEGRLQPDRASLRCVEGVEQHRREFVHRTNRMALRFAGPDGIHARAAGEARVAAADHVHGHAPRRILPAHGGRRLMVAESR